MGGIHRQLDLLERQRLFAQVLNLFRIFGILRVV